jgi:hypothetical protein
LEGFWAGSNRCLFFVHYLVPHQPRQLADERIGGSSPPAW